MDPRSIRPTTERELADLHKNSEELARNLEVMLYTAEMSNTLSYVPFYVWRLYLFNYLDPKVRNSVTILFDKTSMIKGLDYVSEGPNTFAYKISLDYFLYLLRVNTTVVNAIKLDTLDVLFKDRFDQAVWNIVHTNVLFVDVDNQENILERSIVLRVRGRLYTLMCLQRHISTTHVKFNTHLQTELTFRFDQLLPLSNHSYAVIVGEDSVKWIKVSLHHFIRGELINSTNHIVLFYTIATPSNLAIYNTIPASEQILTKSMTITLA